MFFPFFSFSNFFDWKRHNNFQNYSESFWKHPTETFHFCLICHPFWVPGGCYFYYLRAYNFTNTAHNVSKFGLHVEWTRWQTSVHLNLESFNFYKKREVLQEKWWFSPFSIPNIFTIFEYRPFGNIVDILELIYFLSKKLFSMTLNL